MESGIHTVRWFESREIVVELWRAAATVKSSPRIILRASGLIDTTPSMNIGERPAEVQAESPVWPAWEWPRYESQRIEWPSDRKRPATKAKSR